MRRRNVTFFVLLVFLCWNVMTYFFIAYKPLGSKDAYGEVAGLDRAKVEAKVAELQEKLVEQANLHEELLKQLEGIRHGIVKDIVDKGGVKQDGGNVVAGGVKVPVDVPQVGVAVAVGDKDQNHERLDIADPDSVVLPVLVIACNRVSVNRNLDQLIKYRPSADRFPIVVSQDCGDKNTADVIRSYGDQVTHIKHPDLSEIKLPPKEKKFQGYYKIARHYKWALQQIFTTYSHQAVIIIEDDLNISPDFFEYFAATFRILVKDPSLWCVSAWNDNGKSTMVDEKAIEKLYRTDFFPGLGWMLTKDTWLELEDKWPKTFWDDWMRHPDQRKDRTCIRPEISRTSTFGKIGVSKGQFYEKHLKFIKLNDAFVPFTKMDLSYLIKEKYDEEFARRVYSLPLLSLPEVLSNARMEEAEVRVQYSDKDGFKKSAKLLGIMEDLKSGVPRSGYRGVVTFMKGGRRVHFAPPPDWKAYNTDWN